MEKYFDTKFSGALSYQEPIHVRCEHNNTLIVIHISNTSAQFAILGFKNALRQSKQALRNHFLS